MTEDAILDEFRSAEALLEGHFILSSGLHGPRYLQCARVLMDAARAERLATTLARKLPADIVLSIDVVISPAMGGVKSGMKWDERSASARCSSSGPRGSSNCVADSRSVLASAS